MSDRTSENEGRRGGDQVAPIAYTTYAPSGYVCADCKGPIGAEEKAVRLAADHIGGGQVVPDYRHYACYQPKKRAKRSR
ncbi:hypothetical protein IAG44_18735 [Streptomyces roseirectus]|uniref:PARP-type domain-containing protein n=1 Tax=Streptomyces roseirectus TaxID=2768066 RepID=A0A7H0IEQ9_9ACTN|nr:hypothetical protein [Streptomyces roseirectus]QNP71275.1 hypothetical protein IAG44_18735 [Streptomyces roseirectus]